MTMDSDDYLELAQQWQKDLGASADATMIATAILFGIGGCVGLNLREELRGIAENLPYESSP